MNSFAMAPRRFLALLVTIAAAIVLRRYGPAHGLTPFVIRMGAGAFWAATIYFIVALLLRARPRQQILVVAALVCAAIELSKLTHTPALDIFRLTPVGAWLLGRLFSWLNFPAYAAGLVCAWGADALLSSGLPRSSGKWSGARRKR
jgi:hypothetical protein